MVQYTGPALKEMGKTEMTYAGSHVFLNPGLSVCPSVHLSVSPSLSLSLLLS